MKKIAIIIPTLNNGGAERVASNLTYDLKSAFDLDLIVFDNSNQTYPCNCEVIDLHLPKKNGFFGKFLTLLKRVKEVKRVKKKKRYDCTISLLTGPNFVNVASGGKGKNIISIRNNMSMTPMSFFEKQMFKKSCKKADLIVALSETIRQDLITTFKIEENKVVTIYNSVDGNMLMDLTKGDNFFINEPYICTMGRLHEQKGQWHLIRAFVKVHQVFPNLKLLILGEGHLENKLRELVANLGLENNVIFGGYKKNPHSLIANSKLFVFSSIYEGLGNVLLEALACGKTIISTDCIAGPREILAPNTQLNITTNRQLNGIENALYGILVPSFDVKDDIEELQISQKEDLFAKAIINTLMDDSLIKKYELNAIKRANEFSRANISREWIRIINELIK